MSKHEKTAKRIADAIRNRDDGMVIVDRQFEQLEHDIEDALAAAVAAERAKFAAFAGPDGEPLAVLMKGKCGQWPTDEMLEKKIPDGTMLYWILPATSALDAEGVKP